MVTNEFIESLFNIIGNYTFNYITDFKNEKKTEFSMTTLSDCQNMISIVQVGRKLVIDKSNAEIHFNDIDTDVKQITYIQNQLNELGVELVFKFGHCFVALNSKICYELDSVSEKRNNYTIYEISI